MVSTERQHAVTRAKLATTAESLLFLPTFAIGAKGIISTFIAERAGQVIDGKTLVVSLAVLGVSISSLLLAAANQLREKDLVNTPDETVGQFDTPPYTLAGFAARYRGEESKTGLFRSELSRRLTPAFLR